MKHLMIFVLLTIAACGKEKPKQYPVPTRDGNYVMYFKTDMDACMYPPQIDVTIKNNVINGEAKGYVIFEENLVAEFRIMDDSEFSDININANFAYGSNIKGEWWSTTNDCMGTITGYKNTW